MKTLRETQDRGVSNPYFVRVTKGAGFYTSRAVEVTGFDFAFKTATFGYHDEDAMWFSEREAKNVVRVLREKFKNLKKVRVVALAVFPDDM